MTSLQVIAVPFLLQSIDRLVGFVSVGQGRANDSDDRRLKKVKRVEFDISSLCTNTRHVLVYCCCSEGRLGPSL